MHGFVTQWQSRAKCSTGEARSSSANQSRGLVQHCLAKRRQSMAQYRNGNALWGAVKPGNGKAEFCVAMAM